ncbi:hypothetical protein AX15_001196 [Amanita polypyramis BW_CC]|nr:hypothetical protein AX15_001196 [Amanita polypyramis BW_CC]
MEELAHEMRMDEGLMQHFNSLMNSIISVDPFRPTASTSSTDTDYMGVMEAPLSGHVGGTYTQANSFVPAPSASLSPSMATIISPMDYDDTSHNFVQYPNDALSQSVLQQTGAPTYDIAPLDNAHHYDENGDFFGCDRDTITGPRANPKDMDQFLDMACTEQFDGNATVGEALAKLGLRSQHDLIPGMAVPLMPHQIIGVAWMLDKEASKLKGGALGDEMGLGKTVQMIAVMVKNRSKDPLCKTNLIVAPPALLNQWKLEIELKTNNTLSCLVYHGQNRPTRREELLKHDVVLTTFGTMSKEWFDAEKEGKKLERLQMQRKRKGSQLGPDSSGTDNEHEYTAKKRKTSRDNLLFDIEFYRVILDEAQLVRNRKTRMSRAVLELQATHRWCLTGTPIINSLSDVYPYLRFIRVSPWYDFTEFQQHIGRIEKNNPSLAVYRLQAIIATFLLRRMKDSKLDGKRLIELPEKNVGMVQLDFSPEERDIYRMVEIRSQAKFNKFLRAGTVLKNYHQVLVLLLRLRQICSHPSLITEDGNAFVMPGETDKMHSNQGKCDDLARACKLVSPEFVEKMKIKLREAALFRVKAEKESVDATVEDDECPICFDIRTDSIVTPCTHMFCRECIMDVLNIPSVEDTDEIAKYKGDERPCPVCRSPISKDKLFSRAAFESAINDNNAGSSKPENTDEDDLSDFIVPNAGEKRTPRRIKKGFHLQESVEESEETLVENANKAFKLIPRFLPSTKMKYMMEAVKKILDEKPDEKALVISQWTSCLSLVSGYLNEFDISHIKYQGNMRRPERDRAIRDFMTGTNARVMLMSLKCGGVGLNLTRANNVILLDLAWSPAIEAQAFDRVHRLGQTREVNVEKLVISNTVEDRILQLQQRKQQLADGSLGEGSGKKIGRLSVRELANLFGLDVRGRRITDYA